MFFANTTFWNGFMILNFLLKWYVTECFILCQSQWNQIYSIKVAVLFSNGIACIVFFFQYSQ